jgi:hypothetical protein
MLFATCAACTLWLMVQNTILFTLLPWHRLPAILIGPAPMLRATVVLVVQLALLPIAFGLGWLISGRVAGTTKSGERAHE